MLETLHLLDYLGNETDCHEEIVKSMTWGSGRYCDLNLAKGQELLVQALLDVGAHVDVSRGEYR